MGDSPHLFATIHFPGGRESPMRRHALLMIVSLAGLVHADAAHGHFLFIRIGAHAEAGRTVEVFFSERAEAGDPRFIEKVATTKLSVQSPPGKFRPLKVRRGTDRLRACLPSSGSVSVDGELVYGVVTRKVPFLLRLGGRGRSGVFGAQPPVAHVLRAPFGRPQPHGFENWKY